eukprot:13455371-Alexandrium_andersonii.AAC.1
MSASLVGSEMCIRDRLRSPPERTSRRLLENARNGSNLLQTACGAVRRLSLHVRRWPTLARVGMKFRRGRWPVVGTEGLASQRPGLGETQRSKEAGSKPRIP